MAVESTLVIGLNRLNEQYPGAISPSHSKSRQLACCDSLTRLPFFGLPRQQGETGLQAVWSLLSPLSLLFFSAPLAFTSSDIHLYPRKHLDTLLHSSDQYSLSLFHLPYFTSEHCSLDYLSFHLFSTLRTHSICQQHSSDTSTQRLLSPVLPLTTTTPSRTSLSSYQDV